MSPQETIDFENGQTGIGEVNRKRHKPSDRIANIDQLKKKFLPSLHVSRLVVFAVNLAMVLVGSLNVHNCPIQKEITLFLIAIGATGILAAFVGYLTQRFEKKLQKIKHIETSLYLVHLIAICFGIKWVFGIYQPSYDPADGPLYCNKTVYKFAFAYIIMVLIVVGLFVIFSTILVFCLCYLASNLLGKLRKFIDLIKESEEEEDEEKNGGETATIVLSKVDD